MPAFSELSAEEKSELWACLALRHTRGIGALQAKKLYDAYGSALRAVQACLSDPKEWSQKDLISWKTSVEFARERWRTHAQLEWRNLQDKNTSFLYLGHRAYPELLQNISDPPLLLYLSGNDELLQNPAVGIVGSRKCTKEGIELAAFFAESLSAAGITIISGLAKGIDRAAHVAGLQACGSSIAVLGTGINVLYPACNADLKDALSRGGLLISEFPFDAQPLAKHFPIRNRVISGLCRGLLVVEAAARSGSLITARLSLEQGREVFAIPGHSKSIYSEGCKELIRVGAKAVFDADDILIELAPLLTEDARKFFFDRQKKQSEQEKTREAFLNPAHHARVKKEEKKAFAELSLFSPDTALGQKKKNNNIKNTNVKNDTPKHATQHLSTQSHIKGSTCILTEATAKKSLDPESLSGIEKNILVSLFEKKHIDNLVEDLGVNSSELSSILLVLEMKKLVKRFPGMYYESEVELGS